MFERRTSIIPVRPAFYGSRGRLDHRAICVYAALGFFLDADTFWTDLKALPAASDCRFDASGNLMSAKPHFRWRCEPRSITFDRAVDEFAELFEKIIVEQVEGRRAILPLSGGLDSRTLAAALKRVDSSVTACSYRFEGGLDETAFARKIADTRDFPFHGWTVKSGYLWDVVDNLATINGCFSEFTHPRQMAFRDKYRDLGDIFCLGHWGDVLFDDAGVSDDLSLHKQVETVMHKVIKKGGMELGGALWTAWGLYGGFRDYLTERIEALLAAIDIPHNANARIRAFKSMYWAPRWTSVNLSVFESVGPVALPYYDDRVCEFVCTVPEQFLSGRRIQIEYIKRRAPALARIAWQDHRPFNLFNYRWDKVPWNLPLRAAGLVGRAVSPKKFVRRNWELQFLGEENDKHLRTRLFDEPRLSEWIPKEVVRDFYQKFRRDDPVRYSHAVSMLLTFSLFSKRSFTFQPPTAPEASRAVAAAPAYGFG